MNEALALQIYNAFPKGRPPERPVTGHRCLECDEVDDLLGGRVWSDVAADFPDYCHDVFPLLTPAAQAYYLPAFMVAAFDSEYGIQLHSLESALEDGRLDPMAFTPAQRATVQSWATTYLGPIGEGEPVDRIVERWRAISV
jgi:hypothetical protein